MFYVQKRKSVKTGREYIGLFCDLGYRVACLSVDRALCSELLNIAHRFLCLSVGAYGCPRGD